MAYTFEYIEDESAPFPHVIKISGDGMVVDYALIRWCERNVHEVQLAPGRKSKRWESGSYEGSMALFFYNKSDAMAFRLRH